MHNKEIENFFDNLGDTFDAPEASKELEEHKARGERIDHLIHKLFEQNEEGRELLETWKESLIMQPTADAGMDLLEVGIREGQKRFIKSIILTVKRVEKP